MAHGQPHAHGAASKGDKRGHHIHWASHYDLFVRLFTFGRGGGVRRKTIDLAALRPGDAVVELGCGTAELSRRAKQAVGSEGRVIAIDPSPEMLAEARTLAGKEDADVEFREAGMQATGLPDECANVVIVSLAVHHVYEEDRTRAFAEILRILTNNGRFVIVDFEGPRGFFGKVMMTLLLHPKGPQIISEAENWFSDQGPVALERYTLPFPGLQALVGVKRPPP